MPINAAFVKGWSRVYELRTKQRSAAGGTVYGKHLPTGLRHVLATSWKVEEALLTQLNSSTSLAREEFLEVCYWKTPRGIGKAASNPGTTVVATSATAFRLLTGTPPNLQDAVTTLSSKLIGVGIPTASALLTMAYPDLATVLDIRALDTLFANNHLVSTAPGWQAILAAKPQWPVTVTSTTVNAYRKAARGWWGRVERFWSGEYDAYVQICLGILAQCGGPPLKLRDVDRALWSAGGTSRPPC